MKSTRSLVVVAVVLVAMGAPRAQDKGAWFGTPLPPPMSDPRKPVMKYDDVFAPVPVHFAHRPGRFDELLDGAALKKDQRRIVGFSLESLAAGDKVWGRRAATPAFMHTLEWTAGALKAAGLTDATVETRGPGPDGAAVVEVQVAGDPAFGLAPERHAAVGVSATGRRDRQPDGAVDLVGRGSDADLAGRDVKGKIAVIRIRPEPSLFGSAEQGAAARLVERGAVGVINAVEGPGNALYFDPRFACGKAPCFMVGGQDGWFLEQVIGKAANAGVLDRLKVSMRLVSEEQTGLTSANGVAVIPGILRRNGSSSTPTRRLFQGGDDNASGLAVLLGLARIRGSWRRSTLMFVASGGHHSPGNGRRRSSRRTGAEGRHAVVSTSRRRLSRRPGKTRAVTTPA